MASADHSTIELRHEATPDDMSAVGDIVAATGFFNAAEVAIAVELVEERLEIGPPPGIFSSSQKRRDAFSAIRVMGRSTERKAVLICSGSPSTRRNKAGASDDCSWMKRSG